MEHTAGEHTAQDLEIDRGELSLVEVRSHAPAQLADGQARLAVERFGLSANNVTYGVVGDMLQYWDFFPAELPWGRVPVWGFGRVVESRSGELTEGRRVFGYLPMSTELVVEPGRLDEQGFSDVAEHRAAMAAAYSRYTFTDADRIHRDDREPHQLLLYPLFFTSFVIDDFVDDRGFGAEQVWLSSASSKTSIGTAFLLRRRGAGTVIGLTSPGNRAFVESLGVYDQVLAYGEVATLVPAPAVYVDVAGDDAVTRAVHRHLGDGLAHSMRVGGTHWDQEPDAGATAGEPLPGPTPEFFFAPAQLAKRAHEWGKDVLDERAAEAWHAYADWVDGWITFEHHEGADAVAATWRDLVANRADPRVGHVCTLAPAGGTDPAAQGEEGAP